MADGRPLLDSIPFQLLRRIADRVKKVFYTEDWPENVDPIVVNAEPWAIERWLREHRAAEGVPLSYNYRGQDLDVRIPWGQDDDGRQRELHIRGKGRHPEGPTELYAHLELSRYEHTDAHIDGVGLSWDDGMAALQRTFEGPPSLEAPPFEFHI